MWNHLYWFNNNLLLFCNGPLESLQFFSFYGQLCHGQRKTFECISKDEFFKVELLSSGLGFVLRLGKVLTKLLSEDFKLPPVSFTLNLPLVLPSSSPREEKAGLFCVFFPYLNFPFLYCEFFWNVTNFWVQGRKTVVGREPLILPEFGLQLFSLSLWKRIGSLFTEFWQE